ncbi:flagellar motor switch protein FliG [Simkania negevensis]|uniref:Flagellar motor switch protein FliG n=1 Tax=Simkania negevensis TaxID=83561 RepID=A0ABS3ARM0_9BACT|nr:flagellar motor switch protein FliG [Simkania negevensis]
MDRFDAESTYRQLSNPQKAALLLIALGQKWASEIMRQLKEDEIKKISYWIGQMHYVPQELTERITKDFYERLQKQTTLTSSGGRDYLYGILAQMMGAERASELVDDLAQPKQQRAFNILKRIDPKQLATFFRHEQSQAVALIMAYLESVHAARIIEALPKEKQVEVVMRLAVLEDTDPDIVEEMEKTLKDSLSSVATGRIKKEVGGVKIVADILNSLTPTAEQFIMEQISEKDFDLATEIKELMFVFDDLVLLDDKSTQALLKEIEQDDLIVALKGANEGVVDKVFKNISKRQVSTIKDELAFMGPVKASVVHAAQQKIVNIIRKLDEEGKILISGKGGGDEIIS